MLHEQRVARCEVVASGILPPPSNACTDYTPFARTRCSARLAPAEGARTASRERHGAGLERRPGWRARRAAVSRPLPSRLARPPRVAVRLRRAGAAGVEREVRRSRRGAAVRDPAALRGGGSPDVSPRRRDRGLALRARDGSRRRRVELRGRRGPPGLGAQRPRARGAEPGSREPPARRLAGLRVAGDRARELGGLHGGGRARGRLRCQRRSLLRLGARRPPRLDPPRQPGRRPQPRGAGRPRLRGRRQADPVPRRWAPRMAGDDRSGAGALPGRQPRQRAHAPGADRVHGPAVACRRAAPSGGGDRQVRHRRRRPERTGGQPRDAHRARALRAGRGGAAPGLRDRVRLRSQRDLPRRGGGRGRRPRDAPRRPLGRCGPRGERVASSARRPELRGGADRAAGARGGARRLHDAGLGAARLGASRGPGSRGPSVASERDPVLHRHAAGRPPLVLRVRAGDVAEPGRVGAPLRRPVPERHRLRGLDPPHARLDADGLERSGARRALPPDARAARHAGGAATRRRVLHHGRHGRRGPDPRDRLLAGLRRVLRQPRALGRGAGGRDRACGALARRGAESPLLPLLPHVRGARPVPRPRALLRRAGRRRRQVPRRAALDRRAEQRGRARPGARGTPGADSLPAQARARGAPSRSDRRSGR